MSAAQDQSDRGERQIEEPGRVGAVLLRKGVQQVPAVQVREVVQRVPGVDGESLSPAGVEAVAGPAALQVQPHLSRRLTMGEIACALSHVSLYRRILEEGLEMACILEDDVELAPGFADVLRAAAATPGSFELVLLGHHSARHEPVTGAETCLWSRAVGPGHRLARLVELPMGAYGYLVRRAAAAKLIRHASPVRMPADWVTGRSPEAGVALYGVRPPCVVPVPVTRLPTTIPGRYRWEPGPRPHRPPWLETARALGGRAHLFLRRLGLRPDSYCRPLAVPAGNEESGSRSGSTADPAVASPDRLRVLVLHPHLDTFGGAGTVAAFLLEGLAQRYQVSLLDVARSDLAASDRFHGTRLATLRIRRFQASALTRATWATLPWNLRRLEIGLFARDARALLAREPHDVVFAACGEIDLGDPVIQWIDFPSQDALRGGEHRLPAHALTPLVNAYRLAMARLLPQRPGTIRQNLALVNSEYTALEYARVWGVRPRVLYPPVPEDLAERPWEEREPGFVCIGRISPEKRFEVLVRIVEAVRARGHDVSLDIVGTRWDARYLARVTAAVASAGPWARLHLDLARAELADLVTRRRYGLHGMVGEHFGIAAAELQQAGLITFVPHRSGSRDRVGPLLAVPVAVLAPSSADRLRSLAAARVLGAAEVRPVRSTLLCESS